MKSYSQLCHSEPIRKLENCIQSATSPMSNTVYCLATVLYYSTYATQYHCSHGILLMYDTLSHCNSTAMTNLQTCILGCLQDQVGTMLGRPDYDHHSMLSVVEQSPSHSPVVPCICTFTYRRIVTHKKLADSHTHTYITTYVLPHVPFVFSLASPYPGCS